MACGVVITAILLVITLAITLSASPRGGGSEGGCITPDVCNSNILNYIDNSFDPCDDFFSYSCGNWLSANPLNGRSMWDIFNKLAVDWGEPERAPHKREVRAVGLSVCLSVSLSVVLSVRS